MADHEQQRLTPSEKVALVLGSYKVNNIAAYCQEKNVDRSYLYQLRRELEAAALEEWTERRVGRPAKEDGSSLETLQMELGETRQQLQEARQEAVRWELRSEVQGYYLENIEKALKKTAESESALPNRAARRRARRKGG